MLKVHLITNSVQPTLCGHVEKKEYRFVSTYVGYTGLWHAPLLLTVCFLATTALKCQSATAMGTILEAWSLNNVATNMSKKIFTLFWKNIHSNCSIIIVSFQTYVWQGTIKYTLMLTAWNVCKNSIIVKWRWAETTSQPPLTKWKCYLNIVYI